MNNSEKYVEKLEKLIALAQELYPLDIEKRKIYIKNRLKNATKYGTIRDNG